MIENSVMLARLQYVHLTRSKKRKKRVLNLLRKVHGFRNGYKPKPKTDQDFVVRLSAKQVVSYLREKRISP